MQACSHATLRPLTHTTLASASALLATANAGAISTEEAYAPMAERLRSCAASHRIQTGRMRKSTRAVVTWLGLGLGLGLGLEDAEVDQGGGDLWCHGKHVTCMCIYAVRPRLPRLVGRYGARTIVPRRDKAALRLRYSQYAGGRYAYPASGTHSTHGTAAALYGFTCQHRR